VIGRPEEALAPSVIGRVLKGTGVGAGKLMLCEAGVNTKIVLFEAAR
jgi:hypothetical protein